MSCVLGFDVGTRLIGVAVGNRLTASARAVATLAVHEGGPDWAKLDTLMQDWQPDALIVGLPLNWSGGTQTMTGTARRFARALEDRYGLPTHMVDERHSSQEAARRFAGARAAGHRRKHDAELLDAMAAAVIVESWLGASDHPATPSPALDGTA